MDGTQDTAMVEQETIILRYVLGLEVKERLFSVQKVYDASAAGIFELLKTNVEQQGLKMENIIGESFDGASNMRGEFGGVQKLIRDVSPNSVYTWCYAHVLNLAATDMVENITEVKNLIDLLQSTATFFSHSCKRIDVWSRIMIDEVVGSAKLKKLQKIGDTRWWSKQAALETIFGPYNNQKSGTYFVMLKVLNEIVNHPKFNAKASFEASTLLEKWLQFSNILTAYLLLLVYSILRQASDYLQTSGLDYLSAWNMVQSSKDEIHRIAFDTVYEASINFTHSMNAKLAEDDLDDIKVESKTLKLKTRMPGEQASDMVARIQLCSFVQMFLDE